MPTPEDSGKCTHFQPADLVALAEKHLRDAGIQEPEWEGKRFEWGGLIDSPPFNGLVLGCKHKNGGWVITRIDRRKDGVPEDQIGFREIV